ncbi:MAG: DoxX family protein [Deltaproteobacteria bacterium]|nr:DoxX family protein [Deltaproteobacteria bacterium]
MAQNSGRFGSLIGRILLSLIFVLAGFGKIGDWSATADYMASRGMPAIPFFLTMTILVETVGGLSLLLGYRTKAAALALFLFLVPATLLFHNFWTYPEELQKIQMIMFLKNLAIMGGLLTIAAAGPGPISLDARSNGGVRS